MRNHPHIAMLDFVASALPRRAVHLLLLAIGLSGTGATIVALSHGLEAANGHAVAAASAPIPANAPAAPTLLPAVIVRPETELPVLATVTVRAIGTEPVGVLAVRSRALPVHAVTSFASAGSAGTGFGMPYYSFGKPLHRATEE
jgi:hypothetical protein